MICTIVSNCAYAQVDCSNSPGPSNDLCQDAISITGFISGTTCCASIENIDQCNSMSSGVWYVYSQNDNGSLIFVENIDINGPIGVEIYSGNCGNLSLLQKSDCAGFSTRTFEIENCYSEILIHLTSAKDGCGSFEITVSDINDCIFAESCDEITAELTFNPVSDGNQECISSCIQFACDSECTSNGVWFQVNTDNDASALQINIENTYFEPLITVIRSDDCVNRQVIINCQIMPLGEFIKLDVIPNSTYFIEISYSSGIPGSFNMCIGSIKDFVDCSSGTLTVSRPSFPGEDPSGPYCPGETVMFCYEVEFYVDIPGTGNNCQWLQGIIPVIGAGWDQSATSLASQAPMSWVWLDEGNVDYNASSEVLSLAQNTNGDLILEYGQGGISDGDLLPGGWWFTSPGGTGSTNDGDPDNMYGLEWPCGETMTFSHCFELTARDIQSINDCSDENNIDLSVKIFNLADGETGCYNDVTCSGDTPVIFNGSIDCSTLLDINAQNKEICSGDFADLEVSITNGFEVPVIIEVIDQGNTTGGQDWIFELGRGMIPDQITNLGNQTETITYQATLYNSSSVCQPPLAVFEMLVQPSLELSVQTDYIMFEGDSEMVTAPSGFDSYEWLDPNKQSVSQTPEAVLDMDGDYTLIVTQGVCEAREIVNVNQIAALPTGLIANDIIVCDDYIGTNPTVVDLTVLQEIGVDGNWYDENNMLISDPTNIDFTGYPIGSLSYRFETTNAVLPCVNENYVLTLNIVDCECPSLELSLPPSLCVETNALELSDFEVTNEMGSWSVESGPDVSTLNLNNTLLSINEGTVAGDYTLTYTLDDISGTPACNDQASIILSIIAPPEMVLIDQVPACNAPTGDEPNVIDLDDLFVSGSNGTWSSEDGLTIEADNTVSFVGEAVDDYTFTYTSNDAQAPCSEIQLSSIVSVKDCSCPNLIIADIDNFCQVAGDFNLTDLLVDAGPGEWSLSSANTFNLPDIQNNSSLVFTDITSVGDYTLSYTLDASNNVPQGCDNFVDLDFTVFDGPFVVLYKTADACNGYNGNLEQIFYLNDLIQGGSGGGEWSTNESELTVEADHTVSFFGVAPGEYEIIYTTTHAQAPCEDVSESVIFTVKDCACPIVDVFQFPDLCIGEDTFDLNNYIDTNAPGEWYINGIVGTNAIAIIDDHFLRYSEYAEVGEYTLSYELYNLGYDPDCSLEGSVVFNIYEDPYAILIPDTTVCNMNIGIGPDFLTMDNLVIEGSDGNWTPDDLNLSVESNSDVFFTGMPAGEYMISYTTNTANFPCVDQSYEVRVTVLECSCPIVDLEDINPLCTSSDMINLDDYLDNPSGAPGSWTIIDSNGDEMSMIEIDPDSLGSGSYSVNFQWTDAPQGTCSDMASSILEIYEQPIIDIMPEFSVCNEAGAQAPTCIDLSTFVSDSTGDWVQAPNFTGDFSDITNVCFEGIQGGSTFEFSYLTNVAEFPCQDVGSNTMITVEDCSCPFLNLIDPGPVCNQNDMLVLSDLEGNNIDDGTWSQVGGPQQMDISSGVFEADQLTPGMYTLQYTPVNTPLPHCEQFSQVEIEVIPSFNAGLGTDIEMCEKENEMLVLFDHLVDADNCGAWSDISQSGSAGSSFNPNGTLQPEALTPGIYKFEYLHDNLFPCDDQASVVSVEINSTPIANAGEDFELNCSVGQGMIGSSASSAGNNIEYEWTSPSGIVIPQNDVMMIEIQEAGTYVIEVRDINTGCNAFDQVEVTEDLVVPSFDVNVQSSPCEFNT